MSKFKVGDRVRVYDGCKGIDIGVVRPYEPSLQGFVRVDCPTRTFYVFPQQCRKLTPAKPRRRVWLEREDVDFVTTGGRIVSTRVLKGYIAGKQYNDEIEFVEVRPKKNKQDCQYCNTIEGCSCKREKK